MQAARDQWRTPPELYAWANRLIGPFDYDAACDRTNALARPLWTAAGFEHKDSLSCAWPAGALIWCNPPYSGIDPWVDSAIGCNSVVAMLLMAPNGESRFAKLFANSHEIHIVGRIAFLNEDGRPDTGNPRGSSLFIVNPPFGAGQRSFIARNEIYRRTK